MVRLLKKALHRLGLHRAELSILFVNDKRMKILNHSYRGINRTTDVLSFPQIEQNSHPPQGDSVLIRLGQTQYLSLGDIVINLPRAKRNASEQGITFNEELKRLMIHGLLHLIGYNHEKSRYQKNKMREKERELLVLLASL